MVHNMLDCQQTFEAFRAAGVHYFTGVPDSLLKNLCAYISDHAGESAHVIAANEGGAVALAAGHYLATGELGLVYLQNSGLGNTVNPLVSLADPDVYSIPMLLLIGWRGEPGVPDEPQHVKQGAITPAVLQAMQIPFAELPVESREATQAIHDAAGEARRRSAPVALIVRKGTFAKYTLQNRSDNPYHMTREQAIRLIVDRIDPRAVVISTTGKASRELFEYRMELGQDTSRDFLTVGSMGHASQIALGVALAKPSREVYCLDGDGALIMHMGSLAIIGSRQPANLKHVVINNAAHDSVGGQPTAGFRIDISAIATACGYKFTARAETATELAAALETILVATGPSLLEVRTATGARPDLGRPTTGPTHNRDSLMRTLRS